MGEDESSDREAVEAEALPHSQAARDVSAAFKCKEAIVQFCRGNFQRFAIQGWNTVVYIVGSRYLQPCGDCE
ncbi:predicted protein [Histoplasma mississippiense (nom. inval.)]|uniref:predicted protein n=1 Tax=Ajellomyces capsulatus (strain NAm1 / WU24) TaxID=2059318 RepID=UPI000157BC4A|nr:predicted protein [Histoplasma mississippiense (nom. inval.)]EDN05872.1 predicted protein [Histoplasma mississippiense (nom. inval.)]